MNEPQNEAANPEVPVHIADVDLDMDEDDGEPLSLKAANFFRLCWTQRWMFFGIIALGIALSLLMAILEPSYYTATTTLMPPNNASSYSSLMSILTSSSSAMGLGSEALGLESPGELYLSILVSHNVQDSIIARFDLMHYYGAQILDDARKALKGDTQVDQDRKSGIITITVTAGTPALAANLAQAYVTELNRVVTDDSTSSARRERIFLEGRLKDVKQQLDDSAKRLSQFSTKSGTVDLPSQAKSMVDAGLRLQTELIDARGQLASLQQMYSPDNARVRGAEARISALQQQMDALGGRHQTDSSGSEAANGGYPTVGQLPTLGLTYYDLERKMRVDEALWEALTKQYEMAKVEEAEQIPTLRVLDPADVPQRKSGPHRRMILMVGALLSVGAACLAVIIQMIWGQMDPEEEPRKIISEVLNVTLDRRRWYWSIPGLSVIQKRLTSA